MYDQLSLPWHFPPKLQRDFRKVYNSRLISMIKIWHRCLDEGGHGEDFLTEAFDCLNYDILIPILNAYKLDREFWVLSFLCCYLKNRKKITKVNTSYSRFIQIISGISQVFIFGPLFCSIYNIRHTFYQTRDLDITSYADDNTL